MHRLLARQRANRSGLTAETATDIGVGGRGGGGGTSARETS